MMTQSEYMYIFSIIGLVSSVIILSWIAISIVRWILWVNEWVERWERRWRADK
jgi:hypothetical protein